MQVVRGVKNIALDRRTGGLEIAKRVFVPVIRLDRRTGGLEI